MKVLSLKYMGYNPIITPNNEGKVGSQVLLLHMDPWLALKRGTEDATWPRNDPRPTWLAER